MSAIKKEWVSVGAGALISGALAVMLVQAAVIRKTDDSPHLEQARGNAAMDTATGTEVEQAAQAQPRLLLPSGVLGATEQGQAVNPELVVHTGHLETELGKDSLGKSDGHLSGAQGRLVAELDSDKTIQSKRATGEEPSEATEQPGPELRSRFEPRFRPETTPVNAGFDGPELRSPGEEFSWDLHNVFQSTDGPMPFFYVDDDTRTLMFGLGWRH